MRMPLYIPVLQFLAMGGSMSALMDYSLQQIAFMPPRETYSEEHNIAFVCTIDGNRIATRAYSHRGRPYVRGDSYTSPHRFILFSHGNGDNIQTCHDYCKWLAETFQANVITYDYVNYGLSSKGYTTEKNMQNAITAVFYYLTTTLMVPHERIVIFGKSLGTAPSVFLAAQGFAVDINGVILISPLASGIRAFVPAAMASRRILNPLDAAFCPSLSLIQRLHAPVFIVHGEEDTVINIINARILVKHLSKDSFYPPLFVHAGHNDIESSHPTTLREYISAFLRTCDAKRTVLTDSFEYADQITTSLVEYDD